MWSASVKCVGRGIAQACLLIALMAVVAFLSALLYLWPQHNLDNDPLWVATKRSLELPVGQTECFLKESRTLRRGCLDLGAWLGFNEVVSRINLDLRQVDFDLLLGSTAYLIFIIDKSASGFSGIRVSLNDAFDSVYFTALDTGEFQTQRKIAIGEVRPERWNHCTFVVNDAGASFAINGVPVDIGPVRIPALCMPGFRGGLGTSLIDNVRIRSKSGIEDLTDSFDLLTAWYVPRAHAFGIALFLTLLVNLCVGTAQLWSSMDRHRMLSSLVMLNGMLAVVTGGLLLVFDLYQRGYPNLSKRMLATEYVWVYDVTNRRSKEIAAELASASTGNVFKILCVGTSQTFGTGATHKEDAFVARMQELLDRRGVGRTRVTCINAGIIGVVAQSLYEQYEREWVKFKPELVVINLGINDNVPASFRDALRKFAALNQSKQIKTVFVIEPFSMEASPSGKETHGIMRDMGTECGIPVLELHEHMKASCGRGILWWDCAHPTSFGHELIAERLTDFLVSSGLVP